MPKIVNLEQKPGLRDSFQVRTPQFEPQAVSTESGPNLPVSISKLGVFLVKGLLHAEATLLLLLERSTVLIKKGTCQPRLLVPVAVRVAALSAPFLPSFTVVCSRLPFFS